MSTHRHMLQKTIRTEKITSLFLMCFLSFFKKNAVLTAKYETVGYKNLKGVVGSGLF